LCEIGSGGGDVPMLDIPLVTRPEPGHEMPEALPPVAGMEAEPPNCVPRETLGTRDSKNTKDTLPEALPPVLPMEALPPKREIVKIGKIEYGTNKASTLPAHHGVRDLGLGKQAAMGI